MKGKKLIAVYSFICVLLIVAIACTGSTPAVRTSASSGQENPSNNNVPSNTDNNIPSNTKAPPPTKEVIIPTDTLKPLGSARSNPAPVGSEIDVDNMTIKIQGVVDPADKIIKEGNMFNSEPEAGNKYILVDIAVKCNKSTDDKCNLSGFEFSVIDTNGLDHDSEIFLAGVDGMFEGGDFYGGATKTGKIAFIVPIDDKGLIMKYEAIFGGEAYFSIY